jgi:hypothetical protein
LLWPEGDDLTDRLDWTSRNRRLPTESNKEPHCDLFRRLLQRLYFSGAVIFSCSVFWIRDILMWIRILGFVHWSRSVAFKMLKNFFSSKLFAYYLLTVGTFTSVFEDTSYK